MLGALARHCHDVNSLVPIRLALAGLGRIAEYQLVALQSLGATFQLVAVCDPDPLRAGFCPAGVEFYANLQQLLAEVACDAVVVATPTRTHFEVASAVLGAGKHLLLEKPATTSLAQFDALQLAAAESGVVCQAAFHMSRGAETDWAAARLGDITERCGPVRGFAGAFHDALCVDGNLHPRAPSVLGSWLDSGINALSVLARFVTPEALEITSAAFVRDERFPVQEIGSTVKFRGSGLTGEIMTDWTRDTNQKSTLLRFAHGETLRLNHTQETLIWNEDPTTTIHCHRGSSRLVDHYQGVFTDFAMAVGSGVSNQALARSLHRLLFAAAEFR